MVWQTLRGLTTCHSDTLVFFSLLRNARIFPLGIILKRYVHSDYSYLYYKKVCISTAPYAGMDSVGDILDMPISCPSLTITGMSQAKHVGHSSISIIPLATSPSVLIKFASETLWYCALIVLHTPPTELWEVAAFNNIVLIICYLYYSCYRKVGKRKQVCHAHIFHACRYGGGIPSACLRHNMALCRIPLPPPMVATHYLSRSYHQPYYLVASSR